MVSLAVVALFLLNCANHWFKYLVGNVEAIATHQQQQNQYHFDNIGGTTSVHWLSENASLLIGTKKGGIYYALVGQVAERVNGLDSLTGAMRNISDDVMGRLSVLKSNEYKTKYPIYSISVMKQKRMNVPSPFRPSDNDKFLFCGSGDRWISIWRLGNANIDDRIPNLQKRTPGFEFLLKMGPHTGWVKDLVYDDKNHLLHSLGCNCVESWDCSNLSKVQEHESKLISHIAKRTIENSPTVGVTLSSDLLCLCILPLIAKSGDELPPLLASGGVDGRIHLWLSDPIAERAYKSKYSLEGKTPLHTTMAHNGRVNDIAYSSSTETIYTAGNDGFLCIFRASLKKGFELVSKLRIEDASKESSPRITVASVTREFEQQRRCSLALGSSKGNLYFVTAETNAEGGIDSYVVGDCVTVADNSMIYSIASDKDSDPSVTPQLWIGHATGLAMVYGDS